MSHQVLLLRCNEFANGADKNIDIVFIDVFFINLKTDLVGLEIFELSTQDYFKFGLEGVNKHVNQKFFILRSQEREYIIGALAFSVYQNKLDRTVSSIRSEGARDAGTLIATS